MAIVDAHQHCWQLSRPECTWPGEDLAAIYRDFAPGDLESVARPLGVEGSVLVQSQPDDADTHYLLELADRHDWILAVVGWVDLKAPDAPQRIRTLARHPKLRGLRPMLQALDDDAWIDDPALAPAVQAMLDARLSFDALVYTRHLPFLRRFAQRHPDLTIVLDHAAKPPIANGHWQPWQGEMAAMAALPNIYCKLSGLATEAASGQDLAELRPWANEVLARFGAQRTLWGSDWPVLNLVADYPDWLAFTRRLLAPLSEADRDAILAGTARAVYRLDD